MKSKMGRIAAPTTALLLALLAGTISGKHATDNMLLAGRRFSPLPGLQSPRTSFTNNDRSACVTTRCRHVLFETRGGSDGNTGAVSSGVDGLSFSSASANIIGTAASLMETLQTATVSGVNVRGVGALTAIAALTILPLTLLIKQSYALVVGCGLSMATMSLATMSAFGIWPPTKGLSGSNCRASHLLIYTCLLHGLRMASMAIIRDVTAGADPTLTEKDVDTTLCPINWLKRIPFGISVSVLYAVMTSPVMYALRGAISGSDTDRKSPLIDWIGVVVAFAGMALGAITDVYKYVVGPRDTKADDFNEAAETVLNGGVASLPGEGNTKFQLIRYMNIFGEGLFWVGLYVGCVSSFGNDVIAWICGTVMCVGVVGFMFVPLLLHQLLSRIKYDHEEQ